MPSTYLFSVLFSKLSIKSRKKTFRCSIYFFVLVAVIVFVCMKCHYGW